MTDCNARTVILDRRLFYFTFVFIPLMVAVASAQYDICFRKCPNSMLVNWLPFDRRGLTSEAACKQRCLATQSSVVAVWCAAIVYDVQRQMCEMYERNARTLPARLALCLGKDYYERTEFCTITKPVIKPTPPSIGPPPSGTTCGSGQVARFTRIDGVELEGHDDAIIPNVSEQDCIKFCADNKAADGRIVYCRSFDYRASSRQCAISNSEALPPAGRGISRRSAGSAYYQKFCIPDSVAMNCADVVNREAQTVLEGVADLVIQANSFEDCVALCYGRNVARSRCMAGMFFVEGSECILTNRDSRTNPELKIPATNQEIVGYFEIGCGGRGPPRPLVNREKESLKGSESSTDEHEELRNFYVPCPVGQCCQVLPTCLRGLKKMANGTLLWCSNPC